MGGGTVPTPEWSWAIRLQVFEGRPRDVFINHIHNSMAGIVRQPINVASLSTYLEMNVPYIKLPLELKQVLSRQLPTKRSVD